MCDEFEARWPAASPHERAGGPAGCPTQRLLSEPSYPSPFPPPLQVFRAHYHTILRLKSFFPFSLIDAMGSLDEARAQIMRELRYQSSLDLDEATYAAIRCG